MALHSHMHFTNTCLFPPRKRLGCLLESPSVRRWVEGKLTLRTVLNQSQHGALSRSWRSETVCRSLHVCSVRGPCPSQSDSRSDDDASSHLGCDSLNVAFSEQRPHSAQWEKQLEDNTSRQQSGIDDVIIGGHTKGPVHRLGIRRARVDGNCENINGTVHLNFRAWVTGRTQDHMGGGHVRVSIRFYSLKRSGSNGVDGYHRGRGGVHICLL